MREEMKKQKTVEQEIREAQYAGQRALASLHMAEEKLGSARNWGIWDMLGGGFFTDMMKHSKISEASSYICLLYTSPSPRDRQKSRMPSSA